MKNMNDAAKIIGALMVGALVGGVLGILFAPNKGSETRAKLADGAKDMAEDLLNEATALRSKADELKCLAESKMDEVKNIVKQKAETLMHHN